MGQKGFNLILRSENSCNNPEVRPPEMLFNILKRTRNSRGYMAEMYRVTGGASAHAKRPQAEKHLVAESMRTIAGLWGSVHCAQCSLDVYE